MPRLARIAAAAQRPPLSPEQQRVLDLSQWMTPAWLAKVVVEIADVGSTTHVLEPNFGTGEIVTAALCAGAAHVVGVEIDEKLARWNTGILRCAGASPARFSPLVGDFLETSAERFCLDEVGRFDVATMNPPYENGADLAHVLHALTLADRAVAVLRLNALTGKKRTNALWSRFDVRQVLVCAERPDFGEHARSVGGFSRNASPGAESDFCVVDILARPRRLGSRPSFDWIRRPQPESHGDRRSP